MIEYYLVQKPIFVFVFEDITFKVENVLNGFSDFIKDAFKFRHNVNNRKKIIQTN